MGRDLRGTLNNASPSPPCWTHSLASPVRKARVGCLKSRSVVGLKCHDSPTAPGRVPDDSNSGTFFLPGERLCWQVVPLVWLWPPKCVSVCLAGGPWIADGASIVLLPRLRPFPAVTAGPVTSLTSSPRPRGGGQPFSGIRNRRGRQWACVFPSHGVGSRYSPGAATACSRPSRACC